MITIKKISITQLPELIELSYKGDFDLLEKFHIAKFDLIGAKVTTMMMIDLDAKKMKFDYYKIIYDKKPVGYFVVGNKYLYSFAINIKFRTQEIHELWWRKVKDILGKEFESRLYENNTRAIRFLEKRGMIVTTHNKDNSVTLLNYN